MRYAHGAWYGACYGRVRHNPFEEELRPAGHVDLLQPAWQPVPLCLVQQAVATEWQIDQNGGPMLGARLQCAVVRRAIAQAVVELHEIDRERFQHRCQSLRIRRGRRYSYVAQLAGPLPLEHLWQQHLGVRHVMDLQEVQMVRVESVHRSLEAHGSADTVGDGPQNPRRRTLDTPWTRSATLCLGGHGRWRVAGIELGGQETATA